MEYKVDHIIIDRDAMRFLAKTDTMEKALLLVDAEFSDLSTLTLPMDTKKAFSCLAVLEMMLLVKNTTGRPNVPGAIHNYTEHLIQCYELAQQVTMDQRGVLELTKKVATIPAVPIVAMPRLPPVVLRMDPNAAATYTPPVAEPKSSAPKEPGTKPSKGATGRVWEVADKVRAELGGAPVTKEMRMKIIAACEAVGINAGTAATQFGKWKATQQ